MSCASRSRREHKSPAIHSQRHRTFLRQREYCLVVAAGAQMAVQEIPLPFTVPTCPQCGTQMMLVRISRDWPSYFQRTYECPWCPHKMSEVVRSPMVNPAPVAMDTQRV
jgi:predicted RNA-binding Zn-ribbon protein involved in translation (DUF1610 family)